MDRSVKTYAITALYILALLTKKQSHERKLHIALTAPTGEAAARLQEVISRIGEQWCSDPQIREAIPDRAMTVHRLLGFLPPLLPFSP